MVLLCLKIIFMVTVEEAKDLINTHTEVLEVQKIRVSEALGYVLAEDIFSKIDIPGYPQSAMDGYAVNTDGNIVIGDQFEVVAEVQAGDVNLHAIQHGEAARIFTGAPVPDGATTVVIQEVVERNEETILVQKDVRYGANIRARGEQIMTGDTGLQNGTKITPAAMGFLAMMGYDRVKVYRKPVIHLVVTGDELVQPGKELQHGQIYESNSVTICGAVQSYGFEVTEVKFVKDTYEDTLKSLKASLEAADVVLASGGISVGDYDFVGKAFKELGVEEIFYKIKQKPGKPMFYAKHGNTAVFALPGNPASALTGFYQYVLPCLDKMIGLGFSGLKTKWVKMTDSFKKKGDRAQFLKGFVTDAGVEVLEGQSSAMMYSYAITNSIIYIPQDKMEVNAGEEVMVYLLE